MPDPASPLVDAGRGLPRRTVLGAVLGTVAAGAVGATAGCTADRAPTPRRPTAAARPRGVSPDVALAVTAVGRIRQVADQLHRTVARHRGLRRELAGLSALHAAHLRLLHDAVPEDHRDDVGPGDGGHHVPRGAPRALRAALRAEQRLRPQLDELAVRAESGEFARLLAAMSAAVAQQLAVVAS